VLGVRWLVGVLAGLSLLIAANPTWAAPPELAPAPQAIVGGDPSETCEWPQVAALTLGGTCSATLIHPRVLVYAGHCGTLHSQATLGERTDMPARELELLRCERASTVVGVSAMDFAYCELREPVEDLAIAPLLFGCDEALIEVGTPVTIVGFGLDGEGMLGTKHVAQTSIVSVLSLIGIGGMGTGADQGDSGGPAFVLLDDGSWRLLGIVSGGGGGGGTVQYVPAPVTVAWIEARSGIDITPCHAADGSWAPTPACSAFFVGAEPGASWAEGCGGEVSGLSDRCGAAFASEPIDAVAPTVTVLTPEDADAFTEAPVELAVMVEAGDIGWGVREVRLELDGAPWLDGWQRQARDEVPPYEFTELAIMGEGEHAIVAIAEDWAGNVAMSAVVHVQIGQAGDSTDTGDLDTGDSDTGDSDTGDSDTGDSTDDAVDPGSSNSCRCSADANDSARLALLAPILMILGAALGRRRPPIT
jgi:MYXO-CTERM domain-containing protein